GQDGAPVSLETGQVQLIHLTGLEHLALEPLQPLAGHLAVGQATTTQALADGADSAGGAHRFLPAQALDALLDRHEFKSRGGICPGIAGGRNAPIGKELLTEGNAPDMKAFTQYRFEALADNEFGTAPADIHHQSLARIVGQRM